MSGVTGDMCDRVGRTGGLIAKGGNALEYIGVAGGNTGFGWRRVATALGGGRSSKIRCGGSSAGVLTLGVVPPGWVVQGRRLALRVGTWTVAVGGGL